MIQNLVSASAFLAALSSVLAAYFWYRAAKVRAPAAMLQGFSVWGSHTRFAPHAGVDASPMVEYARESGRRNKVAALWSAVAALFAFLGWGLGAYVSWTSAH
jgi:hypothetical protein